MAAPATPKNKIPQLDPSSNFGLNLTDKTGFDPFAAPKTQGAFNQMVLQTAQPQYMPQLQAIQTGQSAENNAFGQRKADIGSIYGQYQTQAQGAYNKLKSDLAAIQAQVAPGSAEANLGAALQSAVGGQNSLAAMMGQSQTNPQQASLPYLGASEAQNAALQQLANAGEAGALQQAGGNLQRVGTERMSELDTESKRHLGAMAGFTQQKQQLAAQIPGIVAKARDALIQELQSGQNLKFQQQLAQKQFGLQQETQRAQTKLEGQKFGETKRVDTANIQQGQRQLDQNDKKINADIAATKLAAAQALAKTTGDAQANAIKYLQGALTPTADMYQDVNVYGTNQKLPDGTADPTYGKKIGTQKVLRDPKAWHVDVGSVLKTLITQYGIPQEQALQMMSSIGGRVYISGQGGQTIADWANTFDARNKARKLGTGGVAQGISQGIANKFHF